MERVSIRREATYVGDENICQYGYGICGAVVRVWKMGLQWNSSSRRDSEVLESYFTFPVQDVEVFELDIQEELERFIILHKKLLQWWLHGYKLPATSKIFRGTQSRIPESLENGEPHGKRR